jgi:hypothetical protein
MRHQIIFVIPEPRAARACNKQRTSSARARIVKRAPALPFAAAAVQIRPMDVQTTRLERTREWDGTLATGGGALASAMILVTSNGTDILCRWSDADAPKASA